MSAEREAANRGVVGSVVGQEARLPEPPTQARGVEKRDQIYAAALARFEREGMSETRIEDVITDAGVSWATFFRYFPRKEDVLVEAIARHFLKHAEVARSDAGDRRKQVRKTLERFLTA